MAMCPECHSSKPFWAQRCFQCNEETPVGRQFASSLRYKFYQLVSWLLIIGAFLFVGWLIF